MANAVQSGGSDTKESTYPNIASLIDTGTITTPDGQSVQFSVMELVTEGALSEMLRVDGRLSASETHTIILPLFDALA
jgi:serine/threonine protein kinase